MLVEAETFDPRPEETCGRNGLSVFGKNTEGLPAPGGWASRYTTPVSSRRTPSTLLSTTPRRDGRGHVAYGERWQEGSPPVWNSTAGPPRSLRSHRSEADTMRGWRERIHASRAFVGEAEATGE